MKLRNILMAVTTIGFMFASADRTHVVGYTAGDYDDMNKYPHNASGQNLAFVNEGESFETVWTDAGTTWGFAGGGNTSLVDMLWANGTFGLSLGVNMDSGTAGGDDAETTMDIGVGMNVAGYDVGFHMGADDAVDGADMNLYARGALGFWAFDTMEFNYMSNDNVTHIDVNMYGVKEWGAATGMFAMGFESTDKYTTVFGADAATLLTTGMSVESTLTDWCDLRIGYDRKFNFAAEDGGTESWEAFYAGVGFNLGSVQLDMTLDTNDDGTSVLSNMMSNPLNYISGYNTDALTASWTLSYTW